MSRSLALFAVIVIAGCSQSKTSQMLIERYAQHKPLLIQLRDMALQDTPAGRCLTLGSQRIGDYVKRGNHWTYLAQQQPFFELSEVLENSALTSQRHQRYVSGLSAIPAEKIISCKLEGSPAEVTVLISSQGFCDRSINWSAAPSKPQPSPHGLDHYDYQTLTDGWFVEVRCS